jgi:hypothetical protein
MRIQIAFDEKSAIKVATDYALQNILKIGEKEFLEELAQKVVEDVKKNISIKVLEDKIIG